MFEDNRSPVQLSTQCPHCQTPLQADVGALQRSKGWARCGRCHYLFDAVAHTGIPTLAPVSSGFADDTPTATPQPPGMRQAVAQAPDGMASVPLSQAPTQHESAAFVRQAADDLGMKSEADPKPQAESDQELGQARGQARSQAVAAVVGTPTTWPSESSTAPASESESAVAGDVPQASYELPDVPSSWQALSQALDDAIPAKQATRSEAAVTDDNLSEPKLQGQAAGDSDVGESLSPIADQAAPDTPTIIQSDPDLLGAPVAAPELVAEPAPAHSGSDQALDADGGASAGVRWVSLLMALVLLLLLGAQLAYFQRDWLVARIPQLQPVAQQVCQRLGCTIEPVQDMSQMRILSSSVMRLHSGELQLDITLENKGELQLAVPTINVLLTDGTDQVFMTHKVKPADWPQVLERLDANSRYPITVRWPTNDADAVRMVGYRTELSYD